MIAAGAGLVLFNTMFYGAIFIAAYVITRTAPPATCLLGLLAFPVILNASEDAATACHTMTRENIDAMFVTPGSPVGSICSASKSTATMSDFGTRFRCAGHVW